MHDIREGSREVKNKKKGAALKTNEICGNKVIEIRRIFQEIYLIV